VCAYPSPVQDTTVAIGPRRSASTKKLGFRPTFSPAEITAQQGSPGGIDPVYFAAAAARGHLHRFSMEALESLDFQAQRYVMQITLLHTAAFFSRLDQIPASKLTEESLCIANKNGFTPLHFAAMKGCLYQIPPELITERALLQATLRGHSVIDYAEAYGHRDQLPPETMPLPAKSILRAVKKKPEPLSRSTATFDFFGEHTPATRAILRPLPTPKPAPVQGASIR